MRHAAAAVPSGILGNVTYRDCLSRYDTVTDDPGRNVVLRLPTGF